MMKFNFYINSLVSYHYCGKFSAPTGEWLHMSRQLKEYELFLVTDGILYIADTEHKYSLKKEEYLIMSPTEKQYGFAPSNCSFYWFHFSPSDFTPSIENKIILPQQDTVPNIERIIILIHQLQDTERRYHHKYTTDMLATGILLELYNQLQILEKGNSPSSKTQLYQAILDYIK